MLYDVLHAYPMLKKTFKTHAAAEQALHNHEAKLKECPELWQAVDHWLTRHKARLISDLPDSSQTELRAETLVIANTII